MYLAYAYYDLAYAYCDLVHAYFQQKWRTLMKISICQIQAYYIPTYLDFSHADLEYADFSQSKKTHKPRTCCRRFCCWKKETKKHIVHILVLPKVTSQFCLDFNSTLLCMVIKNNQHFCFLMHNFKDGFDFVQKEKIRVKNLFLERSFLEEGGHGKIYYGGRN